MIYVVAAHPRSGTSMMMAALKAGGMELAWTGERERHNWQDGSYRPNAGGLYELPTTEQWQPGWPRQHDGKVIKCLVRWIRHLAVHEYRVLWMRRDPEEIRQSYRAAFGVETTCERIEQESDEALAMLMNRRDVKDIRILDYIEVIAEPEEAFSFLQWQGWPICAERAASVVDPKQHRFRRELLEQRGVIGV